MHPWATTIGSVRALDGTARGWSNEAVMKFSLAAIALALIGAAVAFAWRTLDDEAPAEKQSSAATYVAHASLAGLVGSSHLIAVVELVAERDERTQTTSRGDSLLDAVRTFRVIEILKGETIAGDLTVRVTREARLVKGDNGPDRILRYDIPPASRGGARYVVFLRGFKDAVGETVWAYAGHPAQATLSGEDLTFWTPGAVLDERAGSRTLSTATVGSLRSAIASPPPAASPAPGASSEKAIRAANALDSLLPELPSLKTDEALDARIRALGLDAASIGERAYCLKAQGILRDNTTLRVDLGCETLAQ